ncbi:hypothetical protein SAMN05421780_101567 [Flexibacter flexilis DSM 6793]|uniref:Uncharacterized protein n=1 Tax=Flexibacter flexilis DSM 6793 TaxID=927664 RepID=A0A1I1E0M7_9BACT|nr:hypothetical protein SAMN05421780_101567 [Flexibacter flexilis DSM 6793]
MKYALIIHLILGLLVFFFLYYNDKENQLTTQSTISNVSTALVMLSIILLFGSVFAFLHVCPVYIYIEVLWLKKYDNMSAKSLDFLADEYFSQKYKDWNFIRSAIERHCVRIVFKRNNRELKPTHLRSKY